MNLERTAMLAAINTVRPALATKDLIEELTHIWFDGKYAMAYNDADLGIQVPFATPFKGGIRGALLFGLLSNSRAKEVTLEPAGTEASMLFKAARTRVDLAVLPHERAVWKFPKPKPDAALKMSEAFLKGLKDVLVSVGNDTSLPEKMGVTVIWGNGSIDMFTTDSKTIAASNITTKAAAAEKAGQCILPTAFCEQLLRLCKKGDFLEIRADDCVIAGSADGVLIYARLVHAPQPKDFYEIFDRELEQKPQLFEIPGRLALALERALVVMDGTQVDAVKITIGEGKLIVAVDVEGRGELKDVCLVPEELEAMSCTINPLLIKRAIPLCQLMAFGSSLYMTDDKGFEYFAAFMGA